MKLQDLIDKKTLKVEAPAGSVLEVPKVEVAAAPVASAVPDKKKEAEAQATEADIILAGEINADLFCSIVETPFLVANAVMAKKKIKKAKRQMKGDILLKRLEEIKKWKDENKKVIPVADEKYKRMKEVCIKMARLNNGKPSTGLWIGGTLVAMLCERIEIFVE